MSIIRLQNGNGETNVYYEFDPNLKPLGEGGMGRVFRGVQIQERSNGSRKEREVAIKCLMEDLPKHAIDRSRREASIRLKNDNLVEMIDFVETHDNYVTHYHVVSELLNGVNLDDLLAGNTTNHDGKPNPTAERLLRNYSENRKAFVGEVFRSILSGIMALHDAGYIHRDIDPSNIMVTSEGKIKLIDFGIAKKVDELLSEKSLTTPGQFVGKPHYAAPELILGDLRHQSYTTDVYALGIMLFQLVAGHLPFEGSHLEVCEKQKSEKLPSKEIADKTVRKIIEKATEKDQKKRYQSAAEFRVALDRWIAEPTRKEKVKKEKKVEKVDKVQKDPKPIGKWIGVAVACLAVIGLVVYIATRPPKPPKPDEPETDTTIVVEEIKEPVESIPVPTIEKTEVLLKDKLTAKDGWRMLQQLVDSGDVQAAYLMSRIYFDATVMSSRKEFLISDWSTVREDCGIEADNVKAHDLLMQAKDKDNVAVLYELGCDYMWEGRGVTPNYAHAKWCFEELINLPGVNDQYREKATELNNRINGSSNPPKEGVEPQR